MAAASGYELADLWTDTTTVTTGNVRASVPGHGARMFVVSPGENGAPAVSAGVGTGTGGYVEPGETFTATVSVANDGLRPVTDVEVALAVPQDWQVTPAGPTTVPEIAPGRRSTVDFTVIAAAHVPNGVFALTADVRHAAGSLTGYGAVTVAIAPHAAAEVKYYLGGACARFTASAGVDDETAASAR